MLDQIDPIAAPADPAVQGQVVDRTVPTPDPGRAALIGRWEAKLKAAEKHFENDFKRIRKDMEYAREGADRTKWGPEKYTANLIQRHINKKVSDLYAKNPRSIAKRRQRMEFSVWDGTPETLQQAMMSMQQGFQAGLPPDPTIMALLQDVQEAQARKTMLDKVGKTLEILFNYYLEEQEPNFKTSAKQLVRRVITSGVGYVKLEYQRIMEKRPGYQAELADVTNRLAHIESLSANLADGEIDKDSADAEELKVALAALQSEKEMIVREGPVYGFRRATDIIVDPRCRHLVGFVGAGWIADKMHMSASEIQDTYGIDIGKSYTAYNPTNPAQKAQGDCKDGLACVYEVQDKKTGTYFTICEGYPDYLKEPASPDLMIERFYNVFALTFNEVEHEDHIIPYSDVYLIRDMQDDHNRAREGLREQRRANRPKYATGVSTLEQADEDQLKADNANVVLKLQNLGPDMDVNKMLQRLASHPIDPAMYDTTQGLQDINLTVGSQEANLGNVSGGTATESSIAESGRVSSVSSNVDDLDMFLTELARATGQILLREASPETAKKIAGPGAIWPQLSGQEIAEEVLLEIKAGSSGRPNQAASAANLERVAPFLVQLPGISPSYMARTALERLDDDLDLDEAIVEGLPSIVAMNAAAGRPAQPSTGDPATDPAQQGAQGAQNAAQPAQRQMGPQPAFPAAPGVGG